MAKCLIIGANGFIGSHLVDKLIKDKNEIVAFDRFSNRPNFNNNSNIKIAIGNFLNKADLKDALKGVDYVFHFLSLTTPASAERDPLVDVETNIRMSIELFQLCVDEGVKRIIFASTGGTIYGERNLARFKESDIPEPVSPYGIGKLTIEHYLRYFKSVKQLDYLALRLANPYGERQPLHRKQGVIPIFLENILTDKPINIMGDGSMIRDYIYVKDMVDMIAYVFNKETKYNTYNIGSGTGKSINELVNAIKRLTDLNPIINNLPKPATFVDKSVLDISRYESEFGKVKYTSMEKGLKNTLEYLKKEIKNEEKNR